MAETNQANPRPPYRDNDGNEITPVGKAFAGTVIIFFTLFSALYLVGHWPDRIPGPKENSTSLYTYRWFHVRLADSLIDTSEPVQVKTAVKDMQIIDSMSANPDSPAAVVSDTPAPGPELGMPATISTAATDGGLVHINTLLLILVGVAGFLGNMIHISASFTTYIGAGKFRKSWILWYCVKPFTAAALAIAIYFVFRGGFLNMSDDSSNINIYGLMTISILSGLFTDRTTLKLKEVFEVLLRPKEERPDQLKNGGMKVTGVDAAPLEVGKPIPITLMGEKMDEGKVDISIEDKIIQQMERKPASITFSYTLPDTLKDKGSVLLLVKPENAATGNTYALIVKGATAENAQVEEAG